MKLTPCILSAPSSQDDAQLFPEMETIASQQSDTSSLPSQRKKAEINSISQLLRTSSASPESLLAIPTAAEAPATAPVTAGSSALAASPRSGSALTAAPQEAVQRARTAFLERYNPQVCRHMALDADRCFRGCAPALEVVKRRYGTQTAVTWVTIQLSETARLWGSSDKISGEMLEAVAESFVGEYSKLNLAEIGLYLSRLRAGVYGKVAYGKLTPDHLVSHLPTFLAQRSREIDVFHREQERIDRQREHELWASRAVSHEEAKRLYAEALALCDNNPDRAIEYLKRVANPL
ncbi:hypothetical protein [Alloprevotella sp. oral taxon 473]|uniref:hypothetical protein n=1 Tax=Alloprevotella sp. oral taxon 473 TaxID=712469 RepID=UPI0002A32E65|nr:hypothetical protein [Alloprevotella sp. oral taxon 473]EKX93035.1 hypothetical protein HMPREF9999_00453 [Alloprevotella sp. oral taxon 473 str. F0040]